MLYCSNGDNVRSAFAELIKLDTTILVMDAFLTPGTVNYITQLSDREHVEIVHNNFRPMDGHNIRVQNFNSKCDDDKKTVASAIIDRLKAGK